MILKGNGWKGNSSLLGVVLCECRIFTRLPWVQPAAKRAPVIPMAAWRTAIPGVPGAADACGLAVPQGGGARKGGVTV